MKFSIQKCPKCGEFAKGTLETVNGLALLTEPDIDGKSEWQGETKIWWDEQKTVTDARGKVTLVCHKGHDWQSEMEN